MHAISRSPLEIYRGPDRLFFYRGFGLFCVGHTIVWTGLTMYRGWYEKLRSKEMPKLADRISSSKIASLFSGSAGSQKPSVVDDATQERSLQPKSSIIIKFEHWIESHLPKVRELSSKTEKYDNIILTIFTSALAVLTFGMGFIIPRRIVRRITLHNFKNQASNTTEKHLVEVQTYGAFGIRRDGVTFRVPITDVSAMESRAANKAFIHFQVRQKPFRFIVEKSGADFPLPEDYDFTFALQRKF